MLANLHLAVACITGLVVLYADEQAVMWVLGKQKYIHAKQVKFLHHGVSLGLALLLITGGLLYIQAPAAFLSVPLFDVKLIMICVLICNTYAIERLSTVAFTYTYASLSVKQRLPLLVSGGVSFVGWIVVFACGLLISE